MHHRSALLILGLSACLPRPPAFDTDGAPSGDGPQISVSPDSEADMGELVVGCGSEVEVWVRNVGGSELEVFEVDLVADNPDLSWGLEADSPLPWFIEPDEHRLLGTLSFLPLTEFASNNLGTLKVTSDDPDNATVSLPVLGSVISNRMSDSWSAGVYPMDLVFTIDRSGSTMDEVSYLSQAIPAITESLDSHGVHFRMLATTQIDGCHPGSEIWIDNDHSSSIAQALFDEMVDVAASAKTATQGLLRAENALGAEAQTSGGCNDGFRRDDAMLHIFGVSDEADGSPGDSHDYLLTQQEDIKPPYEVVYNAIGASQNCGDAETYHGFLELSDTTQGQFVSVCDGDWWDGLDSLGAALAQRADRATYILSEVPLTETITVEVNFEALDGGWVYSEALNAVVLDDKTVPDHGTAIKVGYFPEPVCE